MPYIQGETIRETLNRETQLGVEEAESACLAEHDHPTVCSICSLVSSVTVATVGVNVNHLKGHRLLAEKHND